MKIHYYFDYHQSNFNLFVLTNQSLKLKKMLNVFDKSFSLVMAIVLIYYLLFFKLNINYKFYF